MRSNLLIVFPPLALALPFPLLFMEREASTAKTTRRPCPEFPMKEMVPKPRDPVPTSKLPIVVPRFTASLVVSNSMDGIAMLEVLTALRKLTLAADCAICCGGCSATFCFSTVSCAEVGASMAVISEGPGCGTITTATASRSNKIA
jgi:hypothetical protein